MAVRKSSNMENLVRGADTLIHQGTMVTKAVLVALALGVSAGLLFCSVVGSLITTSQERYFALKHVAAKVKTFFFLGQSPVDLIVKGKEISVAAADAVKVTDGVFSGVAQRMSLVLAGGVLVACAVGWGISIYWRRRGIEQAEDEFIRGASLVEGQQLGKLILENNEASPITIGGVPTKRGAEMLGTMISGAVGTGKSVSILEVLDSVRTQRKRAIVYDPTGEFTEYYYREGVDVVLNPLDARSKNWNIWREIRSDFDYRTFATALIPYLDKPETFFDDAARIVIEELFRKLAEQGNATNKAIFDAAARIPLPDLFNILKGTSGANLIDPNSDKLAMSVRSNLLNSINGFRYLHDQGEPFSIRSWLEDDDSDSWLFVTTRKDQHEAIKPLITLLLDIAIRGVMNLRPVREPRFWLVIDELPTLQKIQALQTAVTETRKYGLCGVFGIQSVAQMREIYGKDGAQTIMGMCQTWVVLRVADAETAKYLSDTLGMTEIQEKDEGLSFGAESARDGTNLSSKRAQKQIVLASEIQHLPDREGYLRVPGAYPVARIKLEFKARDKIAAPYLPIAGEVLPAGLGGAEQAPEDDLFA